MSRPYFETKVVKVRKEKTKDILLPFCPICSIPINECAYYKKVQKKKNRKEINEFLKPKNNWVNGENLDKIKFPCFVWYMSGTGKRYCELDFINHEKGFYRVRELRQHKEKDYIHAEFFSTDLKPLICSLDFHILKGKIILFEEEVIK